MARIAAYDNRLIKQKKRQVRQTGIQENPENSNRKSPCKNGSFGVTHPPNGSFSVTDPRNGSFGESETGKHTHL